MDEAASRPSVPLLCRLNLRHHWRWEYNDDNERFKRCALCGKDDPHVGTDEGGPGSGRPEFQG